jgi:hypothetical protein
VTDPNNIKTEAQHTTVYFPIDRITWKVLRLRQKTEDCGSGPDGHFTVSDRKELKDLAGDFYALASREYEDLCGPEKWVEIRCFQLPGSSLLTISPATQPF